MTRLPNGHAISAVPLPMVPEAWPYVQGWIREAVEQAWGSTPEDVLLKLSKGEAILWIIEKDMDMKGAVVTEVIDYPRHKSLNIWLTGGENLNEWKQLMAALEGYARAIGCLTVEATGRPGLQRVLKDLGFETPRVTLVKRVDSTTH